MIVVVVVTLLYEVWKFGPVIFLFRDWDLRRWPSKVQTQRHRLPIEGQLRENPPRACAPSPGAESAVRARTSASLRRHVAPSVPFRPHAWLCLYRQKFQDKKKATIFSRTFKKRWKSKKKVHRFIRIIVNRNFLKLKFLNTFSVHAK
jgi:hypothetical protein